MRNSKSKPAAAPKGRVYADGREQRAHAEMLKSMAEKAPRKATKADRRMGFA